MSRQAESIQEMRHTNGALQRTGAGRQPCNVSGDFLIPHCRKKLAEEFAWPLLNPLNEFVYFGMSF